MRIISITELEDRMPGWNRKRLYRAAKRKEIPDTIKPKNSRGGRGGGYRFKMTPALKSWISKQSKISLDGFIIDCQRRISSENPFDKDRWDKILSALVGFGKVVSKKLRKIKTLRGFTDSKKKAVGKALAPLTEFFTGDFV